MSTWTEIKQTVAVALTMQNGLDLTSYSATFNAQFPEALIYAEGRIFRDVPMLAARTVNTSVSTTGGSRSISLSAISPPLLVVEQVGLTLVAGGVVPYDPVSLDFINRYWPVSSITVAPSLTSQYGRYWAMQDNQTIALAPTPDAVYVASLVATTQPAGLTSGNPTTYLSVNYPELLEAGCLVFLTGALTRNFGAQSDEPASAQSWEAQFVKLIALARDEERRRRGLAPDTPTAMQPEMARQAQ